MKKKHYKSWQCPTCYRLVDEQRNRIIERENKKAWKKHLKKSKGQNPDLH